MRHRSQLFTFFLRSLIACCQMFEAAYLLCGVDPCNPQDPVSTVLWPDPPRKTLLHASIQRFYRSHATEMERLHLEQLSSGAKEILQGKLTGSQVKSKNQ